jgi:hypothetical protein
VTGGNLARRRRSATAPDILLQVLVDQVLALCRADSAGVSLLDPGRRRAGAAAATEPAGEGSLRAKDHDLLLREPKRRDMRVHAAHHARTLPKTMTDAQLLGEPPTRKDVVKELSPARLFR